jgi:thymidylate synthase (FAD)
MKLLDNGYIKLRNYMPNNENVIQYISGMARISFGNTEIHSYEEDKKLVEKMYKEKHTSPFEKVITVFEVKCPIFVARQWMRHRTGSYNEISYRYTDVKPDFYVPTEERFTGIKNCVFTYTEFVNVLKNSYEIAFEQYQTLCNKNVPKEIARTILPIGTYTTFYFKIDLHNLFHFMDLRSSCHAQYEIKVYSDAIKKLLSDIGSDWKDLIDIYQNVDE